MKKIKLAKKQKKIAKKILKKYRCNISYNELNDCFTSDLITQANNIYNNELSSTKNKKKAKAARKKFLDKPYASFTNARDDAYKFANIINVSICPYCNEQSIYTVFTKKGEPVSRPEFDHFKKKSKFPELQLSLFNLIPSCHTCNSTLKGQKLFDESTHINPYKADFDEIMKFDLELIGIDYLHPNDFEIIFTPRNKACKYNKLALNNISDFKLIDRYKYHKDEVIKLFKAKQNYDKMKKQEIRDIVLQSNIKLETMLFPEKDCDINSTSLGKLKRDISEKFINNI